MTEDDLSDIDLLQNNSSSNFTLFVDLGNLEQISMQQTDRDVILTIQPVNTAPRNVTEDVSSLNDDDVDVNDEDDESVEESANEETDEENDVDTKENKDDGQSYHDSDSD